MTPGGVQSGTVDGAEGQAIGQRRISEQEPLIAIRDLKVHFNLGGGTFLDKVFGGSSVKRVVKAVDGVTIDIYPGETLGLVGESGCGKSTLGRALLRLMEPTSGQVLFRGQDLAQLSQGQIREHRRHLQMIFQDPYASLNPRMTVGQIIGEPLDTFRLARGLEAEQRVQELMETVGLNKRFIKRFPHEFSGGQRQRIGIARALAVDPDFIVADEPISALDVSIQAQIMNLMERLQRQKNLTYLFISHDLRAIRHVSDRVAVMYLGKLVEIADAKTIYDEPLMPYTKALISAVPVPDPQIEATRQRIVLEGDVPSPINPPQGCRFHTRCPYAIEACRDVVPPLAEIKPDHFAACIRISPEQPYIEQVAPGDAPGLRDAQRIIAT
jgi:oligopeptide transport system ATP-binding protein